MQRFEPLSHTRTATISHQGTSNFAVWALDANLNRRDLLVNEIGAYTGTVRVERGTAGLEINADGSWTVTINP